MTDTNERYTKAAAKALIEAYDNAKGAMIHGYTVAADNIRKGGDIKEVLEYFKEERGMFYANQDSLKTAVNKYKACILLLVKHPVPDAAVYEDTSYEDWSQRQLLEAAKKAGIVSTGKGQGQGTGKPGSATRSVAAFEKRLTALLKEYKGVVSDSEIIAMIKRIEKEIK